MQFQCGNYQHAANSVAFRNISKSIQRGQSGRPHTELWDMNIEGKLIGTGADTQASIWSQLAALMNAYDATNISAVGFPGTPLYIRSSDTIGGITITSPVAHDGIRGAEGVTYLRYSCGIQATFPLAAKKAVLAFQETMSFSDNFGLPMTVERLPQNGLPIIQQISSNSWFYGKQTGSITTAFARAEPLPPLFPGLLRTSGGQAGKRGFPSPTLLRGDVLSFTTTWDYDYISIDPFFSEPNVKD